MKYLYDENGFAFHQWGDPADRGDDEAELPSVLSDETKGLLAIYDSLTPEERQAATFRYEVPEGWPRPAEAAE